ncbi:putative coiled-coil protein SlyX [Bradyrhizobium sp. USDA 3364]
MGRRPRRTAKHDIIGSRNLWSARTPQALGSAKQTGRKKNARRGAMVMIDDAVVSDLRPLLRGPSRRIFCVLVLLLVLVGSSAAGAWLWADLWEFGGTPETHQVASIMRSSLDDRASLSEIKWAQLKASDEIAELNRRIDAAREDLKGILDQISMLTSRIEALRNSMPVASTPSVSAPPSAQAASSRAKKRLGQSTPQGPVSVGGAPVIAAPKASAP